MTTRATRLLLVAVVSGAAGCGMMALWRMPRIAECDVAIPSSTNLRGDLTRRLQVHVEGDDVSVGYQVVLQKRGNRITVVALTRFGATAFTIVQEGEDIEVRSNMGPVEAVPPRNLLGDLYHWPLGILATPEIDVDVRADGRSATIVNRRCNYRTILVESSDAPATDVP